MSASGKKEPEEDGSQADNAEKLSISPKEDNRKAGENAAAENDEGEKARRQYEKIMLFVIGWFTVPFLTGGVWYDLFGGLDAGEVWQRLTHPRELIDALGIYTIAFASFGYLPAKIGKAGWGKRIFYFILFYFLLCRLVDFLF